MTDFSHECTYCPEDNKLRFYPDWTDGDFDKEALKAAGFRWASKQECYVCPRWTTKAEDAALQYVDDIGDEDYSPQERAADRAERFGGYRENRRNDAAGLADRYGAGPDAYGHQNERKAERAAARRDRVRDRSLSQWSKAEYWQRRTAGVISHALHKSSPAVRRGRIKKIESELRSTEKQIADSLARFQAWQAVAAIEDAEAQGKAARTLAGSVSSWAEFQHPHDPTRHDTLYTMLEPYESWGIAPITGAEAAALYLADRLEPGSPGTSSHRVREHLQLRLIYERAMLENEGGMATDIDMEPGGFIGGRQIHKVNKSRATGRVVSVALWGPDWHGSPGLVNVNIERLGEDAYRPPTDAERAAFKKAQQAKPKTPGIFNPTREDAERLQAIWNEGYTGKMGSTGTVREMTQAEYTKRAKWTDCCYTCTLFADGRGMTYTSAIKQAVAEGAEIAGKLRIMPSLYGVNDIVVLSDKKQKPMPVDWEVASQPAAVPVH